MQCMILANKAQFCFWNIACTEQGLLVLKNQNLQKCINRSGIRARFYPGLRQTMPYIAAASADLG